MSDMLNHVCRVCGERYHYCGSCGDDPFDWDLFYKQYGYCSRDCAKSDKNWQYFRDKLKELYDSLREDQKFLLWYLWDKEVFQEEKWESFISEIIQHPGKLDIDYE